ncbi:PRD domain-containing protein, partial [Bacillus sp. WP8]|uniref:PRD domain-containing protein n=1 Tax=Bacillus sp. WP8 TaxID=756828 RepID=UPI0037C06740
MNLSHISINNLILHLPIPSKPITHPNYLSLLPHQITQIPPPKQYNLPKKILHPLQRLLHLSFPQHQILYVTIHLLPTPKILQSFSSTPQKQILHDHTTPLLHLMLNPIH